MEKTDLIAEDSNTCENQSGTVETTSPAKKKFVVPEISVPVDVLEATTFFQSVDSGVTN